MTSARFRPAAFVFLSIGFILISFFSSCRLSAPPRAADGAIDLSSYSFVDKGSVDLRGFWTFELPDGSSGTAHVPGNWKGVKIGSSRMAAIGSAIYRLAVDLPDSAPPLMLRIGEIGTSSQIFVDGECVAVNGVLSSDRAAAVPEVSVRYVPITPRGKTMMIEIHAANFDDVNGGGIWGPITLGTAERISYQRNASLVLESILLGIFLVVFLYYMALFLYRRADISSLLFSLVCACFFFRQAATGEKILQMLIPGITWHTLVRTEYFSLYALAPLYFEFFLSLFPRHLGEIVRLSVLSAGIVSALAVLVLPVPFFIATLHVCQAYWICVLVISYLVLMRSWRSKEEDAFLFLLSFTVLIIAGLNDMLLTRLFVPTVALMTPAQAVFIFFQTLVLSRRLAREYRSSNNLTELNSHLHALDEAKTNFFTASSHELRTPVTLITTPIDAIMAGRYGESIPRDAPVFTLIRRNCDRLKRLADELLDFMRFDAGAVRVSLKPIDLSRFAGDYISLFAPEAASHGVKIESAFEPGCVAMIDSVLFETVILNLLSNALKHAPAGGTISIRVASRDDRVFLSVSDTGPGIPEAQLPRLFERFATATAVRSTDYSGFGVGLPLAAKIVQTLGGSISAENSGSGTGAVFTVDFARYKGAPEEPEIPSRPRVQEYASFGKSAVAGDRPRVLAVDDNRDVLELLAGSLYSGFDLHVAVSADEALSMIESGFRPDVIVSDVMMPGIDGFEFRERLLASEGCAGIPFLYLSARADSGSRNLGLSRGAVDFIKKPFDLDELTAKISSLSSLSRKTRESFERKVLSAIRNDQPSSSAQSDWRSRADSLGMTDRDLEVIALVIRGLGDKEIAAELNLSPRTVSNRVSALLKRTGTQSRTELVSFMMRVG